MLVEFPDMDRKESAAGGLTAIGRIAAVLTPYLGPHMTKTSIEMYQERLGIGAVSTPVQREELIVLLVRGLKAFVGEERTASLATEMRNAAKGD